MTSGYQDFQSKTAHKLLSHLTLRGHVSRDNETSRKNHALLKAPEFGSVLPGSRASPQPGTVANDVGL